ncbi:MAG TPA: hypothetical protein VKB11_03565 [Acidimicrobiia bacterium]|nr:hypothetical protein [Acidimicrobiia bacterium]
MSTTPGIAAGTTRSPTIGRYLVIIGGVLAAVSSWLNWGAKTRELGIARTAYTIPAKFVIDNAAGPGSPGLSLGVVVLVLGVLVVAAAFAPGWKVTGLLLGAAVIVTAFLYVYQVRRVVHDANLGKSVRDFISIGPYLAVIGGLLAVVGAIIALIPPGFWSSLTSEETEEEAGEKPAGGTGAQ